MSSRDDAPRSLRLALYAWPRSTRRESGAVMLDLALDLVDAGASPRREARTLLASGMKVRARRFVHGVRLAPWSGARRLVVLWSTALIAAFIVTSSGGWTGFDSARNLGEGWVDLRQFSHTLFGGWCLVPLLAVAAATAAGKIRLATVLMAVASVVGLQTWVISPGFLGLTALDLGVWHVDGLGPVPRYFSITAGGVVGLLAALAMIALVIETARGPRATISAGRAMRGLAQWCTAVALMPVASRLAWNAIDRWAVPTLDVIAGPLPLLLLWGAAAVAFVGAVTLPRFRPELAVALMLLSVAFVIPIYWSTLGGALVVLELSPVGWLFSSVLGFWGSALLVALMLTVGVPSCAGHTAIRRAAADGEHPAPTREPTVS